MKIAVIGTGYVGLVAATCLADSGNDVICVDIDEAKIEGLKKGVIPIYEPGLEELIRRNVAEGRIVFSTDTKAAVEPSSIVFIAVGTPTGENGQADLSYVFSAAKAIGGAVNGYKIIIDKSTVPVGTADRVREIVAGQTSYEFDVVSNPEFLKEGAAVDDFMRPDRVIIGSESPRAVAVLQELYAPFLRTGAPFITMDARSAEMTKYAANCMLANRISFMNEVANLCEAMGANISAVRDGISSDSRIGHSFLFPGLGYGGSCFPKDVKALIHTGEEAGVPMTIVRAVDEVNERQKTVLVPKVLKRFGDDLAGKTFAIWGLAFKPRTDDMREAPSVSIINELLAHGASIAVYDPEAVQSAKKLFGDKLRYGASDYEILDGADALIVVTEWNEFRRPDFSRMKGLMKAPVIFDGRNIYDVAQMKREGFVYYNIGQPRQGEDVGV